MSEETPDQEKILGQIKSALRQVLDESAYERMMNVMLVNQNLFAATSQKILMYSQRVGRKVTEKEVLILLQTSREAPKSGGISIKRK